MTPTDIEQTLASVWQGTYQVGVVVRDLDVATSFYESLGIGPFVEGPSSEARNRQVHGRPAPEVNVRCRLAQMGRIELELLQPISGAGYQAEFLQRRGEGVVHLCARVDNFEPVVDALSARGLSIVSSGEFDDGGKFAYFETSAVGGLILEIFEDHTSAREGE